MTNNEKQYEVLTSYSKLGEEILIEYENKIFSEIPSKKKRANLEYKRLQAYLKKDTKSYAKYLKDLMRISDLLYLSEIDENITEQAYKEIVKLDIECNVDVRLLSVVHDMIKDIKVADLQDEEDNRNTKRR